MTHSCDLCGRDGLSDEEMTDLGGDHFTDRGVIVYPAICRDCNEGKTCASW